MSDELRKAIGLVREMIERNEEWRNSFDPAKGPISEDQAALALEESARNAILLMPRSLPVLAGSTARSFFGGLPKLPPTLPWPAKVVEGRYRHLTFIAQIDLAEIPPLADSPLPASGSLYFFVDLSREWLEEGDAAVLWQEQPASSLEECQPPLLVQDRAGHPWFWLEPGELTPHPSGKYPIQFVPFRSHRDYLIDPNAKHFPAHRYAAIHSKLQSRSLEAALGPATTSENEWIFAPDDDDWPFAWAVIEHGVRALAASLERACDDAKDPYDAAERCESILAVAQRWRQSADTKEPLGTPDSATRAAFRSQWLEWQDGVAEVAEDCGLEGIRLDSLLREAVRLTCCLCEERQASLERVPGKYRPATSARAERPVSLHQMLGYGEAVQSTPIDRADQVLLLQVKSDLYLEWWPDAEPFGVIQFWIDPEDLAARRFDKVSVTFDCT